jgi:transcriptional regulator with GAF, ATPase, and Fis domain
MPRPDPHDAACRIALVSEIIAALPRPGRSGTFFKRLLGVVFATLDVQRAFVALRDEETGELRRVASRNEETGREGETIDASRTIVEKTLSSGRGQLLVDAGQHHRQAPTTSIERLELRSVLCAPILLREETVGVLLADNRLTDVAFTDDDLDFLGLLGRLAGIALENVHLQEELERENDILRAALREGIGLLTASPVMESVVHALRRAARTDVAVLFLGDSGTGKEVAARSLHALSERCDGPFVAVNCAAIPESLLEAELFGLAPRSGIAGAPAEGRPGRFEQADGGTLMLDEIADMSPATQARILRALEQHEVDRIGGVRPIPVDLRIVAATNKDLDAEIESGHFRADLLFRLRVVEIRIPPLRERPEDIALLGETFLRRLSGGRVRLDDTASEALLAHSWPGNVRELRNAIEHALVFCEGGTLRAEHLPAEVTQGAERVSAAMPLTLEEIERAHVESVLRATDGEVTAAARLLGIARNTLYARMRRWGVERPTQGAHH